MPDREDGTTSRGANTSPTAAHVGQRAARGVLLVAGRSGILNVAQLVSSLLLARAVSPTQYAAFAIGTTVVGFGRFLGDGGASSAVIQQPRNLAFDTDDLGRVLYIQIVVAGLAAVTLALGAPFLRSLFHAPPETSLIVVILAGTLLIEVPQVVPKVRLRRKLRYERLTVIELISIFVLYGVQIFGFLAGWQIWALVAGQVAGSLTHTLALLALGGGLVRPHRRGALGLVRRGFAYQGTLVIQALFSMTALVVVGVQLTTEELGLWTWSTVLATPLVTLSLSLHHVYFPSLSRLHEHHASRHAEAVERMARLQALFVGAAVGLLCGFAVPIIRLIYDDRWLGAVSAARLSLVSVIPLTIATLLAASLEASGQPRLRLRAMAASTTVGAVAALPLSGRYGSPGAAAAVYLLVPLLDVAMMLHAERVNLWQTVVNSSAVGGAAFLLAYTLAARAQTVPLLLGLGFGSGLAVLALLALVDREALRFGRSLLRRKPVT